MANFGRVKFLLSLGSNLGDREDNLAAAREALMRSSGKVLRTSALYETAPWGFRSDNLFLNQVIILDSKLTPLEMIQAIIKIETELGRERFENAGYQSRTVDIDILLVGDQIIDIPGLRVPHPRMHERNFVLIPAAEIAAEWRHPVFNKSVSELLAACEDEQKVSRL